MYWDGHEEHWINTVTSDESETELVNEYIQLYADVFSEKEFDQLPE